MDSNISVEEKNLAVASYVTLIGWAVSFAIGSFFGMKTSYTSFHGRQAMGLGLLGLLIWVPVKSYDLLQTGRVLMFVYALLIVYQVIGARGGRRVYVPLLGKVFDVVFAFLK